MRNGIAILNARAGTLLDGGEGEPGRVIGEAFAAIGYKVEVVLAEPDKLEKAIVAASRSTHDVVFVGGGDGTLNLAVAHLAGSGKTLGVLPLGTMNLLARALGGPMPIAEAISAFEGAETVRIDLAYLNGRPFHTISGLGFFTQMARAREQMRGFPLGRWIGFAVSLARAFLRTGRHRLTVEIDGARRPIHAYAILVTNNAFGPPTWQRDRLDGGVLELHIGHDVSFWHRVNAGVDVLTGKWRDNATIETVTARSVTIRSRRSKMWVTLDGELTREATPLRYEIRPGALSVLRPRQAAPGEALPAAPLPTEEAATPRNA